MTQSIDPRLLGQPRTVAPVVVPPPPVAAVPGQVAPALATLPAGAAYWSNEQAAQQTADEDEAVAEARRAALREQVGVAETIGTQFARGALDTLLAPGALVGVGAQSLGSLTGSKALEKFGEDLGKASNAKAAAEALGFVFGGGGENMAGSALGITQTYAEQVNALDASAKAVREIEKQEEARPTLTTVSRMAGMMAAGLGIGVGAGASSGVAATVGANVVEGAAGGAQAVYENHPAAPLKDVLVSAAIGGVLAGAITGAAEGAVTSIKKASQADLSKVFGKVQQFADERMIKSAIGNDAKTMRILTDNGKDFGRVARVAEKMRQADLPNSADEMLGAVTRNLDEATDTLSSLAAKLDAEGLRPSSRDLFDTIDEQIAELRAKGTGTHQNVADALEKQIAPFRAKLQSPVGDADALRNAARQRIAELRAAAPNPVTAAENAARADATEKILRRLEAVDLEGRPRALAPQELLTVRREIRNVLGDERFGAVSQYADPTFTELRRLKTALGEATRWGKRAPSVSDEAMGELYGNVARRLDGAADAAGPEVGAAWRRANQDASDWFVLRDGLEEELQRRLKNRFISPSDYGTGLTGALATLIGTGGAALPALAAGAAGAFGNRLLRHGASKMLGELADRFAKVQFKVPLARAGGKEAQEVLSMLARSRRFIEETAERAGANPTVRATAADVAREVAAAEWAKRAGKFDAASWATKPPNAVAKVVFRGPILDAAAKDVAEATGRALQLVPKIPESLDVARVARLARDADGPAAIGAVQQAIVGLVEGAPATPTGSKMGQVLRKAYDELSRSDVAETFALGHRLSVALDAAAGAAPDDISRQFAARAADELRANIASDAFGSAGKQYRALIVRPELAAPGFTDPKALRDVLRTLDSRGKLSEGAKNISRQILEAHAAAKALGGSAPGADVTRGLQRWERLVEAAESVSTVDGRRMSELIELADHPATKRAPAVNEQTVLDAVAPSLDPISRALRRESPKEVFETLSYEEAFPELDNAAKRGGALPGIIAPKIEEQRRLYRQRTEALARTLNDPGMLADAVPGGAAIGMGASEKLQQLLDDMPKPVETLRGKRDLSSDDLRKANAMWEATLEPLSVFQDFARGQVDYDKVKYAWKQYPGLQQAAQAGVVDVLMHDLSEEQRAKVPDPMLSQLDYLLGFNGKLQPTVDREFAVRMSSMPQQEQKDQPKPGGMLELPGSEPTFTERLARRGS